MHLSIGYQLPDDVDSTHEIVRDFAGQVTNVYFAPPGQASARMRIDAGDESAMIEELRRALMYAIDAEEVKDSVYMGFAEIQPSYECTGDAAKAAELLDEMGMVDIDNDGWRETPSGLPFATQLQISSESNNDWIPVAELNTEYWQNIGFKISVNNVEGALMSTTKSSNGVPMCLDWDNTTMLWCYNDWGTTGWAPLYDLWYNAGGLNKDLDPAQYLAPTGDILEFYQLLGTVTTVSPEEVRVNDVRMMEIVSSECYMIEPLNNIYQAIVFHTDIGNIPTGGCVNSVNYTLEQCFFRTAE